MVVPFIKELTPEIIEECCKEMHQSGLVKLYGKGHKFMEFNGFFKSNQIRKDREGRSDIPAPEDVVQSKSRLTPGQIKLKQSKVKDSPPGPTPKVKHQDFVFLTDQEFEKLTAALGKRKTEQMIERLNNYVGSSGKAYKSHYHTILTWQKRDGEEGDDPTPKGHAL
jgi:hypothetical protein